jgi:hypothetical protein
LPTDTPTAIPTSTPTSTPTSSYPGEIEPNDTCASASAINCEIPNPVSGVIGSPGDIDYFELVIGPYTTLTRVAVFANDTNTDCEPSGWAFGGGLNPSLEVFFDDCITHLSAAADDNNGILCQTRPCNPVLNDAAWPADQTESIVLNPGTYYIQVSGADGTSVGPYVLQLCCEYLPTPTPTPIPVPATGGPGVGLLIIGISVLFLAFRRR